MSKTKPSVIRGGWAVVRLGKIESVHITRLAAKAARSRLKSGQVGEVFRIAGQLFVLAPNDDGATGREVLLGPGAARAKRTKKPVVEVNYQVFP